GEEIPCFGGCQVPDRGRGSIPPRASLRLRSSPALPVASALLPARVRAHPVCQVVWLSPPICPSSRSSREANTRRTLFPSFSCPTAADPEGTFASWSADRGREGPPGLDFAADSYIFAASKPSPRHDPQNSRSAQVPFPIRPTTLGFSSNF